MINHVRSWRTIEVRWPSLASCERKAEWIEKAEHLRFFFFLECVLCISSLSLHLHLWACLPVPSSSRDAALSQGQTTEIMRIQTEVRRHKGKAGGQSESGRKSFTMWVCRVAYPATHFTKPTRRSPYHNRTPVITADDNARRMSSFAHRQIKIADIMSSNSGRKHPPVVLWPSHLQHLLPSSVRNAMWPVETLSALQSH